MDAVIELDRRMIDYCVGLETEFVRVQSGRAHSHSRSIIQEDEALGDRLC